MFLKGHIIPALTFNFTSHLQDDYMLTALEKQIITITQ